MPAGLDHDAVLDLAFGTVVLASFDASAVTFVYDYPASQAALARVKPTTPPVAARFEAFCGGIELANGFHELADAAEQRRRFVRDLELRRAAGRHAPPLDEHLLRALPSLPDCAASRSASIGSWRSRRATTTCAARARLRARRGTD